MTKVDRGFILPAVINPPTERCFQVPVPDDPGYIRAFFGQMSELIHWWAWEKEQSKSGKDVARRWASSYDRITDCDVVVTPPPPSDECCNDLFPTSDAVQFAPNDPFTIPGFTPPGYNSPPWYDPNEIVPGVSFPDVQPDDVLFDWTRIAAEPLNLNFLTLIPSLIAYGFPRFTVNVIGSGTVELHLLKVPFGGLAMITTDGNPLSTGFVEMSTFSITDLDSILAVLSTVLGGVTGTLVYEDIIEVGFESPGEHFIDVTFIPTFSADAIFGWGGGLRKITLCGDLVEGENFMPEFRINGLNLEWRPNTVANWIDLGRVVGADGAQGIPGECPPCPDHVGYGTPVNTSYWCRAARVIVENTIADIDRVTSGVQQWQYTDYDAQALELVLQDAMRNYPSSNEPIGNYDTTVQASVFNGAINHQANYDRIVQVAMCQLLFFLENNIAGLATLWTLADVAERDFSYFVDLAYNPTIPLSDEQCDYLADGVLHVLAWYAAQYPEEFEFLANWEANLSALYGIEDCSGCSGTGGTTCPNIATGGTAQASSVQSGAYNAGKAFDGDTDPEQDSRWQTTTTAGSLPAWLQYEWSTVQNVQLIRIWDSIFGGEIATGKFQIKLNSGDSWTDIANVEDLIPDGVEPNMRYLVLPSLSADFKFFRVYIETVTPSGNWATISEVELFACDTPEA